MAEALADGYVSPLVGRIQPGRIADLERQARQTVGAAPCGQQDHPAIAQEEPRDQSVE